MTPFPWKQGDDADEGVTAFSPEERVMTGDAQDAEYLEPLRKALADLLSRQHESREVSENAAAWADVIVDQLTAAGWRFVTAKDWKAMTHAWVMGALR